MSQGIIIKRAGQTVTVEPGTVALILPVERAHAARVALQPIQSGASTSTATQATREALSKALARVDR